MRRSQTALFPVSLLLSAALFAQQAPLPPPPGTAAQQAPQILSPQELNNLVAPIALYPDPLLSEVLAASTYPLEIIEAQQWVRQAGNLRGQQLMDAAKEQNWDASVQALVAFPDVLSLLTRDIRWTRALGDAFLAQQSDVMNAVQVMRASAQANGRLQSNPQQNVTVEQNPQYPDQQAIDIQPANPDVIYPPQYDPGYVWGPSPYGAYPDLLYPNYGYGYYPPVYLDSYFGGFGGFGFGWGWGFNWFNHGLFVNSLFFNHYGFHGYRGFGGGGYRTWAHDPGHRQGIPYSNGSVAGRYSGGGNYSRGGYGGQSYRGGGTQGFTNQRSNAGQGFRSFSGGQSQARPSEGFRSPSNGAQQRNFGGGQSFRSAPQQSFRAAPQQSFRGAPQQSFRAAPQQSFRSAPQQSFRSAPQRTFSGGRGGAARGGGGGGGGGFHGGGGGGSRGGGGGGGSHGGGGGHR